MVAWALTSLPFLDLPFRPAQTDFRLHTQNLVFIVLQEHEESYNITRNLQNFFGKHISVVRIPKVTRGAVETVLAAKDHIGYKEELIISDSDHFFDGLLYYKTIKDKPKDVVGIIPVFKPPNEEPKWSYTLFDKNHIALAVGEKDPLLAKKGAYANIGAYYFLSGKAFIAEAEAMIAENDVYGESGKQEFYIAPLYDRLIKKGEKVEVSILPKVWGLGTPRDLEFFLQTYQS